MQLCRIKLYYNMKKALLTLSLLMLSSVFIFGSTERILLNDPSHQHDHSEYYAPADMPVVYLNLETSQIIIEAEGFADYYIVEVNSMVSGLTLIYTQIDSYGDTIDVSSLPDAYYQIIITSSNNNMFEGTFLIE